MPRTPRLRYNRQNVSSATRAADRATRIDGRTRYVFATAGGFTVAFSKPPRGQPFVEIVPLTAKPCPGFGR